MPKNQPETKDLAETGPKGLRSSLAPFGGERRDVEGLRRDAWHDFGAVAVPFDDARLHPEEAGALYAIGLRLFGPRVSKNHT